MNVLIPPSAVATKMENVITYAKDQAEKTCEPPSIIIKCNENMSPTSMAQLSNRQAMLKIIRRKRNEVTQVPENLRAIQELPSPHEYMMYSINLHQKLRKISV